MLILLAHFVALEHDFWDNLSHVRQAKLAVASW